MFSFASACWARPPAPLSTLTSAVDERRARCETLATAQGLPFAVKHKSNGAPAGCVQYEDGRVLWLETCRSSRNCGTTNCNGCKVLRTEAPEAESRLSAASCSSLKTEASCVGGKEGRDMPGSSLTDGEGRLLSGMGLSNVKGEPCNWCCGDACTSQSGNVCEPRGWLLLQKDYFGRSKNGLGDDTCSRDEQELQQESQQASQHKESRHDSSKSAVLGGGGQEQPPLSSVDPQMVGGWTHVDDLSAGGDEYKLAAFALHQLSKGEPYGSDATKAALEGSQVRAPLTSAQTQVVSGVNHRINAQISVGSLGLLMYEQSWTETLTLEKVMLDGDVLENTPIDLNYTQLASFTPPEPAPLLGSLGSAALNSSSNSMAS